MCGRFGVEPTYVQLARCCIVMSGRPVSREELAAIGAVAFIAKPFELDELVARLCARTGHANPRAA